MWKPELADRLADRHASRARVPARPRHRITWPARGVTVAHDEALAQRARRQQMRVLATIVHRGDVVWDIGARHGLLSVFAARRVGARGVVHAFEPSPRNRWFIEHHVRWNELGNVIVHDVALGASEGWTTVEAAPGSRPRPLALVRARDTVLVRSARTLVESGAAPAPDVLRIDVEGDEANVLQGALASIPSSTRLLISVHSREAFHACTELLGRYDYRVIESRELQRVLDGDAWCGEPDLVCFGPGYDRWRRDLGRLQFIAY